MLLKKLSILFTFLFSITVFAGNVNFTASVNRNQVATGERFEIKFTLNSNGSNFTPPSFSAGFRVLSGPNQSSSTQWINGQTSSRITYSYILLAVKEGKYSIPSASIKVGKEVLKTKPITITITKGASVPKAQQRQQQQPSTKGAKDNVFIKVFVNKTKVYQGEQIVATYKLYTKFQIVDNDMPKLPDLTGFWTQDVDIKPELKPENINGVRYNSAILKQTILFPQRAGKLELDQLVFDCIIRVPSNRQPRSIFDFFGSYQDVKLSVKSKPVKIEVSPLPYSNKPKSFTGAVGKFSMETTINKNQVKANDAINLKVKISGSGNLKLLEPPNINFPPDFEIYDPKINDRIAVTSSGVSGKREFEYLIIPRHEGSYTIPPVSFSYFNPSKKQYITLSSDTLKIAVGKGDESTAATFSSSNKEDIKFIGKDIRYIKTNKMELNEKDKYFFASATFYGLFALPFLLFFLLFVLNKQYIKQQGDVVRLKSRRANKMAKKRLTTAKKLMQKNEKVAFYEEVFRAMYGYLSDRLNIPIADLSKESIAQTLTERNTTKEVIDKLISSLDLCELARFAPVNDTSEQQVYDEAISIISEIEGVLK